MFVIYNIYVIISLESSDKMRLGIMQPYFFPYIGYISLIKHTNKFILFDTVQFIKHGWIERNRIIKQDKGWTYISVPLQKHNLKTNIKDIKINNETDWRKKVLEQLNVYKRKAPYYNEVISLIKESLNIDTDNITILNKHILENICKYLNINCDIEIFSNMNLNIEEAKAPDEWALNICKALGNVDEYWNPPGGATFFDPQKYQESGINIKFQNVKIEPYIDRKSVV